MLLHVVCAREFLETSELLIKLNRYRRGELEQSLAKAQAELDSLKEERRTQMKMTESIVRQRDMYRVLLAQATGVSFPQQGKSIKYTVISH